MLSSSLQCLERKVRSSITEHIGLFQGNKYHLQKWPTKSNNRLCFFVFSQHFLSPNSHQNNCCIFNLFLCQFCQTSFFPHYFLVSSLLFLNNKNSNRVHFIMICVKGNACLLNHFSKLILLNLTFSDESSGVWCILCASFRTAERVRNISSVLRRQSGFCS